MNSRSIKIYKTAITLSMALALSCAATTSYARGDAFTLSEASGASVAIPIAVVSVAASAVVTGATVLTVTAIKVSAHGTAIVLENLAQGISTTIHLAADGLHGFTSGAGAVLSVALVAGGAILYDGQRAVAMVPNATGSALMHNEVLSR